MPDSASPQHLTSLVRSLDERRDPCSAAPPARVFPPKASRPPKSTRHPSKPAPSGDFDVATLDGDCRDTDSYPVPPGAVTMPTPSSVKRHALLLNSTYEPLAIITWERAMTLMLLEKCEVLAYRDESVNSATRSWQLPSVVRLVRYVKQRFQPLRFTRTNLYLRDSYTCVYCHTRFPARDLTWDHVHPRSLGGVTDWTNIVTACFRCNSKKGDRTPEQAGMPLARKPFKPSLPYAMRLALGLHEAPEAWRAYLFWVV
jgi:5-methylcytosine-specific restriction endonuclease McrA